MIVSKIYQNISNSSNKAVVYSFKVKHQHFIQSVPAGFLFLFCSLILRQVELYIYSHIKDVIKLTFHYLLSCSSGELMSSIQYDMEILSLRRRRSLAFSPAHTYRECASDQTGSAFWVRVPRYHTTGGDHGHRSLAADLIHLEKQK